MLSSAIATGVRFTLPNVEVVMTRALTRHSGTLVAVACMLAVLAGCDRNPTTADATFSLSVITNESVIITPRLTTVEYSEGTDITFTVTAAPGYVDPIVILDSDEVGLAGTFSMTSDRVLVALAREERQELSSSDPLAQRLQSTFVSPRPELSYQHFLDETVALATRISADSLDKHLHALQNWILADDGRVQQYQRMDSLLAGRIFRLRDPYIPSSAGMQAESRLQSSTLPPEATQPRLALIFVNGIINSPGDAAANLMALRVALPPYIINRTRTVYILAYNPSAILPFYSENSCHRMAIAEIIKNPLLYPALFGRSSIALRPWFERKMGCSFTNDFLEVARQALDESILRGTLQKVVPYGASIMIADTIRYLRDVDRRAVLVVAHSQGNLMTAAALRTLPPPSSGTHQCVGYIGVAPPGAQNTTGFETKRVAIAGSRFKDFVLILFPRSNTDITESVKLAEYERAWRYLPEGESLLSLIVGYKLHGFSDSYVDSHHGGDAAVWVRTAATSHMEHLDATCGGGYRGRVRAAANNQEIASATVSFHQHGFPVQTLTTGTDGGFANAALKLRPTLLQVTASGYDTVRIVLPDPSVHRVDSIGPILLTRIGARSGTLSIRVVDDATDGTLYQASIRAARNGAVVADWQVDDRTGIAQGTLPAGTYEITATRTGYRTGAATIVVVREDVTTHAVVRLTANETADFAGEWVYSSYCTASLGFVDAVASYQQTGASVAGSIRMQSTNAGGGWFTVAGSVQQRTLTGNSVAWIERNPNWSLNTGWRQTVNEENTAITGAAPITGCPDVGWQRRLGAQAAQDGQVDAPAALAPTAHDSPGMVSPRKN
jgi:hypothetical protein